MIAAPRTSLAAVPTLDGIADGASIDGHPVATIAVLHERAAVASARLHSRLLTLTVTPTSETIVATTTDADVRVFTTSTLAKLWDMPTSKIRDLCRAGRLPAQKLGKDWIIAAAALGERLALGPGVDIVGSETLPSTRDSQTGQASTPGTRAFTVSIRTAPRRPRGDREEVGSGNAGDARDGRAADSDAR